VKEAHVRHFTNSARLLLAEARPSNWIAAHKEVREAFVLQLETGSRHRVAPAIQLSERLATSLMSHDASSSASAWPLRFSCSPPRFSRSPWPPN